MYNFLSYTSGQCNLIGVIRCARHRKQVSGLSQEVFAGYNFSAKFRARLLVPHNNIYLLVPNPERLRTFEQFGVGQGVKGNCNTETE